MGPSRAQSALPVFHHAANNERNWHWICGQMQEPWINEDSEAVSSASIPKPTKSAISGNTKIYIDWMFSDTSLLKWHRYMMEWSGNEQGPWIDKNSVTIASLIKSPGEIIILNSLVIKVCWNAIDIWWNDVAVNDMWTCAGIMNQ